MSGRWGSATRMGTGSALATPPTVKTYTKRWPHRPRPGTHCDTYVGSWDTGCTSPPRVREPSWCPNPAAETLLHPERDAVCWLCTPCANERVARGYRRNPKRRP